MKTLALAALFTALVSAAHAAPWFVQSQTTACPRADALMTPDARCKTLERGARVEWNGKVIDGFGPHYLGGNVARLGDGRFVYANFLAATPPRDDFQRSFVLKRDAIACPSRFKIADALEARATRNDKWFSETGCSIVPRGTRAERLDAALTPAPDYWRMRVEMSQDVAVPLWMSATAFR